MQMLPDGQFTADLGNLQRIVGQLPETGMMRFDKIWKDEVIRRMGQGNTLTGTAYKDAQSNIGKAVRRVRQSDPELASALQDASMALDGAARRSSPADAVAKLDAADRFYAKGVRIDTASNYAGGEMGRMSPSQYLRAVKNEDGSLRGRGFNAGNALNQDLAEQFARLGDAVPNSGTFDRVAMASAAGGLGFLEPTSLTALGALGALNAPGIRNLTTGMLAPRKGKKLKDLADGIRKLGPLLGTVGAGGALSLSSR